LNIAILAYFGLFYLENLNSDFGFLNANRQSPGPHRDSENLQKIAIPRFEKNALKVGKTHFRLRIFSRCRVVSRNKCVIRECDGKDERQQVREHSFKVKVMQRPENIDR